MRRSSSETREHVLAVAHDLFYWHGIRAVGVDRIAAEAGIAPTTLYRLFASKDDLITAYVVRGGALYQQWFEQALGDPATRDARAQVLALFDALTDQVHPSRCRGCPFLIALAETPDADHPANRAARATKAWVRRRFGDLAKEAGVRRPDEFASRLALIMEGVYACVQATGTDAPARDARALVDDLFTFAGA